MKKLTKGEIRVLMMLFVAVFIIGTTVGFAIGTVYTERKSKEFIDSVSESNENKFQIGNNIYTITKENVISSNFTEFNFTNIETNKMEE